MRNVTVKLAHFYSDTMPGINFYYAHMTAGGRYPRRTEGTSEYLQQGYAGGNSSNKMSQSHYLCPLLETSSQTKSYTSLSA